MQNVQARQKHYIRVCNGPAASARDNILHVPPHTRRACEGATGLKYLNNENGRCMCSPLHVDWRADIRLSICVPVSNTALRSTPTFI